MNASGACRRSLQAALLKPGGPLHHRGPWAVLPATVARWPQFYRLLAGHTERRCTPLCSGLASTPRAYSTRSAQPSAGPRSAIEREAPSFAFAFDIDGVLLHVSRPIPGAAEALAYLHENHIPFILLTNGGGKHESDRAADLSAKLGVPLTTDNFVQSHTPFQELASTTLKGKTILVTGSDAPRCREIAERYGFRDVVIPADLLVASGATIFPFDPLLGSAYRDQARPLPRPLWGTAEAAAGREEEALKIDAIFVFDDPRDWALDIQLITDLLLSRGGRLGTYSALNGTRGGWQADGQPELYFSNGDLFWSASYHLPRLGQGAFQAALAGVWRRVTGGEAELRRTTIGKPSGETYAFAEAVMGRHRAEVLGRWRHGAHHHHYHHRLAAAAGVARADADHAALRRVYMVGDNPESDIAGANAYRSPDGVDWASVLVRTGVWHPDRGEMRHQPRVIVDDVREAVRWALEEEGWKGKF